MLIFNLLFCYNFYRETAISYLEKEVDHVGPHHIRSVYHHSSTIYCRFLALDDIGHVPAPFSLVIHDVLLIIPCICIICPCVCACTYRNTRMHGYAFKATVLFLLDRLSTIGCTCQSRINHFEDEPIEEKKEEKKHNADYIVGVVETWIS